MYDQLNFRTLVGLTYCDSVKPSDEEFETDIKSLG